MGLITVSTMRALLIMSLFVLVFLVSRRKWLACLIAGAIPALITLQSENLSVDVTLAILAGSLIIFTLVRWGFLSLACLYFASLLLLWAPMTLDFSRWYAGHGLFYVLIVAALAVWGFLTSLGGKPAFGASRLDEA